MKEETHKNEVVRKTFFTFSVNYDKDGNILSSSLYAQKPTDEDVQESLKNFSIHDLNIPCDEHMEILNKMAFDGVYGSYEGGNLQDLASEFLYAQGCSPISYLSFLPEILQFPNYREIETIEEHLKEFMKMGETGIQKKNLDQKLQWKKEINSSVARDIEKRIDSEFEESKSNKVSTKHKQQGYIYLIKDEKYYKVGKSLNFKSRIKTYRTENPRETKVILCRKVSDYTNCETEIIQTLDSEKNHRGEWFILEQDDIDLIKKIIKKYEIA